MNPTFRLAAFALSAGICSLLAYLAMTHQISGIEDLFKNDKAVQVVKEEKKPPPPPPPPPPKLPPPPPPPTAQRMPPVILPLPPMPSPIPVVEKTEPTPPPKEVEPPRPPPPPVITAASFDRIPDGRAFARYYPDRALERGRGGRVTLRCTVNSAGALVNCVVVSEDPQGWDFGEQSVKMAQREFRVRPRTENGAPTDGGVITFPIRWNPE
jgi:periplasmic protein TonB